MTTPTRRWHWKDVFGVNYTKKYDLLCLIGEKDETFDSQYSRDLPCVFFLVPYEHVQALCSGKQDMISAQYESSNCSWQSRAPSCTDDENVGL
jgi:hypothetical protein